MPTLTDAVRALDGRLRLARESRVSARRTRFVKVLFAGPSVAETSLASTLVLLPFPPTNAEDVLGRLLAQGAAAIIVPDSGVDLDSLDAHTASRLLVLDQDEDWADTANVLRSMTSAEGASLATATRSADLFQLAQELATRLDGAVCIVDRGGGVLGYSAQTRHPIDDVRRRSILLLKEEVNPRVDADYARLEKSIHSLYFPGSDARLDRIALAVRAGGDVLGSVWLIPPRGRMPAESASLLDSLHAVVARRMLDARERQLANERRNTDLLRTLVEDRDAGRDTAARLGCVAGASYRALVFTELPSAAGEPGIRTYAMLREVSLLARASFEWSVCAIVHADVVCVVQTTPHGDESSTSELAAKVIRSNDGVGAGCGRATSTLEDVSSSLRDAVSLAHLSQSHPLKGSDVTQVRFSAFESRRETLAIRRVAPLLSQTDTIAGDFVEVIAANDAKAGTRYVDTVTTYLNCLGDVRRTSEALHVHVNTVRYRLARLEAELGARFDDPDFTLWTWLRARTAQLAR